MTNQRWPCRNTSPEANTVWILFCVLAIMLTPLHETSARDFEVQHVSDKICLVSGPQSSEVQVVIQSEKGLVVFDSFWSEITAQNFKDEIAKALRRDDFAYNINTCDRIDLFGGNASYEEAMIIANSHFLEKYEGHEDEVEAEIQRLIEMWRWKEEISRERLETHAEGSEEAINEQRWLETCKSRAEELEAGFSFVLPSLFFSDRLTLDLGDVTLELIWFGKGGHYNGMSVAVVPEESVAIIPSFIMHPGHLAPHPHGEYAELDVPRWIAVLEELLEGEDAVETVICGIGEVWSRERAQTHLEYIRRLWNSVRDAEAEGKDLREIMGKCSLENDFAFVKDMQIYKNSGDDWVRPQHRTHVWLFFLQQKDELASEIIMRAGADSLQAALEKIRNSRDRGADIYIDEALINGIGYSLMNDGRVAEAIEVFNLNVEAFPGSFNVYDSLGEAHMNNADRQEAIENYQKSLELNPENDNAREMLEKLQAGD
jgi:tetratricopeptide (TPR) repeat protein